jgi:hypothetical protein
MKEKIKEFPAMKEKATTVCCIDSADKPMVKFKHQG